MPNETTFHCSVVTPEASVLETEAGFVAFPAHDGEIGILRNRAPLVCKLGIGELRLDTPKGKRCFFVDGGFAQVVQNKVIVLTPQAVAREDLDPDQARQELEEAGTLPGDSLDAQERRRLARTRARAKIRIAAGRT